MSDRQRVTVTIESSQEGERSVYIYPGEWFRKDRSFFIRYEEKQEGEQAADPVRTVVRYREGELSVTRRGSVESELVFALGGERRIGRYRSPYTAFLMETDTQKLLLAGGADEELPAPPFALEWQYELWIDGQLSGSFHNKLQVAPEERQA